MENIPIEETNGYKVAIAFKPFIDPKCTEHMEIVKDMARAINGALNKCNTHNPDLLSQIETLKIQLQFEKGERVSINGLVYQKGINENSFYSAIV